VEYSNLALVITDEQHRFGVDQRKALAGGISPPHRMVMSATPIPRTLGVIYYGDLDISVIDELPARRLPIKNCVVDSSWRDKANRFIKREVDAGHQAYIICPMIEASEGLDVENVIDYSRNLKKVFPGYSIAMLHGRMKPAEKNKIMEDFASHKIQILVSTTVVEVGVDVPNATVIMIENAERFGLAALHQLRGRVGRGDAQSYAIFMSGQESEDIRRRLDILNRSNDGFEIAEKDFELRGPGDLLGIRQSGDALFDVADLLRDRDVLAKAGEIAAIIMHDDPAQISETYSVLRTRLNAYMSKESVNLIL
jgi:ATP-dependent DNA helicase RecG